MVWPNLANPILANPFLANPFFCVVLWLVLVWIVVGVGVGVSVCVVVCWCVFCCCFLWLSVVCCGGSCWWCGYWFGPPCAGPISPGPPSGGPSLHRTSPSQDRPKFRAFIPSPATNFVLFLSLCVFSLNFGGFCERDPQMSTFGLWDCGVKPQRLWAAGASHNNPRTPNVHI